MKKFMLEVCVDSVESAIAAERAGAKRIELCSNLVIGGTTPSPKLFEAIKEKTDLNIHVLIRPRFGDFCYSEHEYNIIKEEMIMFREMGAKGVVIGSLNPDGSLNMDHMTDLMAQRGDNMRVTLHRAFDVCADPHDTLDKAINLGINTILTSGQCDDCLKGAKLLYALQKKAKGKIQLMIGCGVNDEVIKKMYLMTGVTAYHMSGKVIQDSPMTYRNDKVHMGLKGLSEFEIYKTDEEKIRSAIRVLQSLK